ncbi:MAG: hypothetical protein BWK76_24965 [Desulfobulbaceae bacterium A2]|nr:MAG: hypothetical protein BWK76_24965 [Desulfobulbaceae bacterium A2]
MQQFNLIVLDDAVSSSHVDGRAFIGGDLIGGEYAGHSSSTPASAYAGLTVLGNATGVAVNGLGATVQGTLQGATINSGAGMVRGDASNVNFNGSDKSAVGGTATNVNFNGGQYTGTEATAAIDSAMATATSTDFASLFSRTASSVSQMLDTGGSVVISGNTVTFNAKAVDGVAVFDLCAIDTQVFNAGEFLFNLNGATTVIFNSDEVDIDISANFLGGAAVSLGSQLLWNFYNAETVDLFNQFGGSILAATASLSNQGNIEGAVVVESLQQYAEIHLQPFSGTLTEPVPEPATCVMMLAGLGLLGFRHSRRNRGETCLPD